MTHILNITPASALCSPSRTAESAKEQAARRVTIFACRLIKLMQVTALPAEPPIHRLPPARRAEGNSCAALCCKTQMCFMADDNRLPPHHASPRLSIPVIDASALLFPRPCSPLQAVISCTTIHRFLIDLFKMLDTTGCTQLSHIKFPEPGVQLGSW